MAVRSGFRSAPLLFFYALDDLLEIWQPEFSRGNEILSVLIQNMERQPDVRICGYAEYVVPHYTDNEFRSHFRLARTSAEILVRLLAGCLLNR